MKIQLILKTAVVAMAAFGAFSFSESNEQNYPFKKFHYDDGNNCISIEAKCANEGAEDCKIIVGNSAEPVLDLICKNSVKHTSTQPVEWRN